MREVIQKWYDWLKRATSSEKEELAYVYSDGQQLWATDGYSLHARRVATDRRGRVAVDDDGLLQVQAGNHVPALNATLPQSKPAAVVIVDRDRLLQALSGQDRHVRLAVFPTAEALELSSAGAYALVMPVTILEEEDFWRPAHE